jgi:lysophospholipase L1-like esterase
VTRRSVALALLSLPLAVIALLLVEVVVALRGDYLVETNFLVQQTVRPPQGSQGGRGGSPFDLWVLGDSTAAGVGARDEASSLPVLIADRVAAASGRPVDVKGLGVSGARTHDVLTEQVPLLPETGLDAVVVIVGSNDVTHLSAPWTIGEQTRRLVKALKARTEAPVILGGIPRFAEIGALPEPLRTVTDLYAAVLRARQAAAVAERDDVRFVDIAALASPRFIGRPEAMSRDDFHPSGIGYGFWADALAPAVAMIANRAG